VSGGDFSYAEIASQASNVPYKCVEGPDGRISIEVEHNEEKLALTPEQVTGIMLERMRDTAAGTGPERATDTEEKCAALTTTLAILAWSHPCLQRSLARR